MRDMTIRQYLLLMLIGTVMCWGAVALIMTMIDPTESQATIFALFYFSLFFSLTGTFSILGFLSRIGILSKRYNLSRQVAVSFRQAVILSLLLVAGLFLQGRGLLDWWNAILMAAALSMVESFFLSLSARQKKVGSAA